MLKSIKAFYVVSVVESDHTHRHNKMAPITAANLLLRLSPQNVTHYHDHHHAVEFRKKLTTVSL